MGCLLRPGVPHLLGLPGLAEFPTAPHKGAVASWWAMSRVAGWIGRACRCCCGGCCGGCALLVPPCWGCWCACPPVGGAAVTCCGIPGYRAICSLERVHLLRATGLYLRATPVRIGRCPAEAGSPPAAAVVLAAAALLVGSCAVVRLPPALVVAVGMCAGCLACCLFRPVVCGISAASLLCTAYAPLLLPCQQRRGSVAVRHVGTWGSHSRASHGVTSAEFLARVLWAKRCNGSVLWSLQCDWLCNLTGCCKHADCKTASNMHVVQLF